MKKKSLRPEEPAHQPQSDWEVPCSRGEGESYRFAKGRKSLRQAEKKKAMKPKGKGSSIGGKRRKKRTCLAIALLSFHRRRNCSNRPKEKYIYGKKEKS